LAQMTVVVGTSRRLHSEELTMLSKILQMLLLTTMMALPTFHRMKLIENTILVTGIGRGRAEAFHALCPHESLGLLNQIRKFFAGFATGAEGRWDPATNLPRPKTSSLSSVTTPNGPWVYTVVPWED